MLMKIFSPLFLVIGVLGNIANFYAFNKSHMKAYSTFRFLSYLSIIDLLVLIIGLPQIITIAYSKNEYDFRHYSDFVCSLHSFLTMFFTHFSSILLAAVSIDRVYVLRKLRPNKKATPILVLENVRRTENQANKLLAQPKHGKMVRNQSSPNLFVTKHSRSHRRFTSVEFITLIIGFIIFLVDSHFLIWMRLQTFEMKSSENSTNVSVTQEILCYPSEKDIFYSYFFKNIWPWLDLLLYCIIPFTIMIICSILIIFRLFKLSQSLKYWNKKSNKRIDADSVAGNNRRNSIQIEKKVNQNLLKKTTDFSSNNNLSNLNMSETNDNNKAMKRVVSSNDIQKRRARKNRHIYNVLLCLNLVFFLLVTPVVIFNSFDLLEFNNNNGILVSVCYFLAYSNHTFNFIFYLLSSKPYRDIFNNLFTKYKTYFKNVFNLQAKNELSASIELNVMSNNKNYFTNEYEKD